MAVFTIGNGDGWSGLYVDSKIVDQGHRLNPFELLKVAKEHGPVTAVLEFEADYDWLEDNGYLPDDFADVKVRR